MKERPILFSAPMVRALPSPPGEQWWAILGVQSDAARQEIDAAYRTLRSKHHPDKGGDPEQFQRVQRAYEAATK